MSPTKYSQYAKAGFALAYLTYLGFSIVSTSRRYENTASELANSCARLMLGNHSASDSPILTYRKSSRIGAWKYLYYRRSWIRYALRLMMAVSVSLTGTGRAHWLLTLCVFMV